MLVAQLGEENISHIGGKCGSELTGLLGFDSGWEIAKSLFVETGGGGWRSLFLSRGCGVGPGLISRCRCAIHLVWGPGCGSGKVLQ